MGILGNFSRISYGPMIYRSGGAQAWGRGNQSTGKNRWRNYAYREGATAILPLVARPHGYYPPACWRLPITGGAMGAYSDVTAGATARGSEGFNLGGSSAVVFDAEATGKLIAGAEGLAEIVFDGDGDIFGAAAGAGAAAIEFGASADIGALGGMVGGADIVFDGALGSFAIGWMEGTTEEGGMTPAGVAAAVWDALAADHDLAGTMGQKLNAAGTAGDPWTADLDDYAEGTAGQVLRDMLTAEEKALVQEQLMNIHEVLGLDIGKILTETPTSRAVGTKTWERTGDGVTSATLERKT